MDSPAAEEPAEAEQPEQTEEGGEDKLPTPTDDPAEDVKGDVGEVGETTDPPAEPAGDESGFDLDAFKQKMASGGEGMTFSKFHNGKSKKVPRTLWITATNKIYWNPSKVFNISQLQAIRHQGNQDSVAMVSSGKAHADKTFELKFPERTIVLEANSAEDKEYFLNGITALQSSLA